MAKILPEHSVCISALDNSTCRKSLDFMVIKDDPRDPSKRGLLGTKLIEINRSIFSQYEVSPELLYDGKSVNLSFQTGNTVGAFPLKSPITGRYDFGMVIEPRIGWAGIGPMLGNMGWRCIPQLVPLPMLPTSSRKIPSWVLSTVILMRIQQLLKTIDRRFEFCDGILRAPRGQVNWQKYVTTSLSSMKCLDLPCRFPDLRDDQHLLAAVHYVLRKQLAALSSQRKFGQVVNQLMQWCETLLIPVKSAPMRQPTPRELGQWLNGVFVSQPLQLGIEAMEWVIDERGLAGKSDLQGLPWKMNMPDFFEAWVELIAEKSLLRIGGQLCSGRTSETVVPISWSNPTQGTQKSLKPDFVIHGDDHTLILDAKFKTHWYELNNDRWGKMGENIQHSHRNDLLQVLAYSTLFDTKRITSCLVYPCSLKTWQSLKDTNRLNQRASVYSGKRNIDLLLTAVPMGGPVDDISSCLAEALIES